MPADAGPVQVDFDTLEGSATGDVDYVSASGTVTFEPGQTEKTVTIEIIGDTLNEADETFFLVLSNPVGATIADGEGVGTILNDDAPTATLAISDVNFLEGQSGTTNAELTVTLNGETGQTVTVGFATADGTAQTADNDYVATTGGLSFPIGTTTRTIQVAVVGDTKVEPDETFFVNLSDPVGALLADSQGEVTVQNDDPDPGPSELVVWTNAVGVLVSGNDLTKTASSGWGNAGASSTRALDGDGYVEFAATPMDRPEFANCEAMFGLSADDANQTPGDIDFALAACSGTLRVYEGGVLVGVFGYYSPGDSLRVAVENGSIRYRRNGQLLRTSPQTPSLPLRADTALYLTGATIEGAMFAGMLVNVETGGTSGNAVGSAERP
jgi:hypothetical protein